MNFILIAILFVPVTVFHAGDSRASWLIDEGRYHVSAHGTMSCQDCHADIAVKEIHPGHREVNTQASGFFRLEQCTDCHEDVLDDADIGTHGGEKIIDRERFLFCIECHDPHAQSSHERPGSRPDPHDPAEKKISGSHEIQKKIRSFLAEDELCMRCHGRHAQMEIHHFRTSNDEALCLRCHFPGNSFGAAAMVLPAKSVICMPCHAAAFSMSDTISVLALAFFVLGMLGLGSVWFSGSHGREKDSCNERKVFRNFRKIPGVLYKAPILTSIRTLVLDGLLQRRLFRASKARWAIHALIFASLGFRFLWGLTALVASLWWPGWSGVPILLDKNHPINAFFFDCLGALFILGVCMMVVRKFMAGSRIRLEGMPGKDWLAYGLLGGIIVAGFLLEGIRIAMTGSPPGSGYAFIGYAVSRLFIGADLTGPYGYVWYSHALLTGAFVAYLPFSRMIHMIIAPVVLVINAASGDSDRIR